MVEFIVSNWSYLTGAIAILAFIMSLSSIETIIESLSNTYQTVVNYIESFDSE